MCQNQREKEREKKNESSKGRDTESLKYGTTLVYFGGREREREKEKEKERVLGASGPRHVSSTASFDDWKGCIVASTWRYISG